MTNHLVQAPPETYEQQHTRVHAVCQDFEEVICQLLQLTMATDDLLRLDLQQLGELAASEAADLRQALAHASSDLRFAEYVARDYERLLTTALASTCGSVTRQPWAM